MEDGVSPVGPDGDARPQALKRNMLLSNLLAPVTRALSPLVVAGG